MFLCKSSLSFLLGSSYVKFTSIFYLTLRGSQFVNLKLKSTPVVMDFSQADRWH
jgi:hypothetical protein